MKVVITGGTGFVGSHIVRHLVKDGHGVTVFGRSKPPKELLKYASYEVWDLSQSREKKFQAEVLIHCSSFVDVWEGYNAAYKINVEGTSKIINSSQGTEIFIYLSSGSVYGASQNKKFVKEDSRKPEKYTNSYSETKAEAEELIKKSKEKFHDVTILRPHFIYGPNDRTLIPRVLQSVRYNHAAVVGNGQNQISPTHVGNICQAVTLIINQNKQGLSVYNIADEKPVTLNEIYATLISTFNLDAKIVHIPYQLAYPLAFLSELKQSITKSKTTLLTRDIAKQFTIESTLSIKKAKSELNYDPKLDYVSGFKDLETWVNSVGGLNNYLRNYRDLVWEGKLITY